MGKFFWDDLESKHKYHLSNWLSLAQKKEHGGLDIPDLRDLNLCLLAAWVQRYQGGEETMLWKAIIDKKYKTNSPNILCCEDRNGSPFGKGCTGWPRQLGWGLNGR
jgi:hypothetical protein